MDQSNDGIVNLELLLDSEYCVLKDQESYFNWTEFDFNVDAAKERIERRQCPRDCLDIRECDFCKFDGDWRLQVEPTMFVDGEKDEVNRDKGYLNKFVSWNGEMAFLEGYIGEFEKAENRLNYMDCKIDEYCREGHTEDELEYVNGYKYLSQTLQAYFQSRKECVNYAELGNIQNFPDLHVQAKNAVLSVKFNFYKETRGSFKTQVQVLRKVIYYNFQLQFCFYVKFVKRPNLKFIKKLTGV